jgi:hypothetical protein
MIALKIFGEIKTGSRGGMNDLGAGLKFFPEAVGEKILVGECRGVRLGVEVVIQLLVQGLNHVTAVEAEDTHGLPNERRLRGIKTSHVFRIIERIR